MFGKLVSSISDRNVGVSCFNEQMKEYNCENKGELYGRGTSSIHG